MITRGKLQSFTIKHCRRFFGHISDIASPVISNLRALHLDYYTQEKESKSKRQRIASFFQWFPNLIEATVTCSDIDKLLELFPIQQLHQLSVLHLRYQGYINKATLLLLNGTVKYVDMRSGYIPKLVYSGFLREFRMVYNIIPLPDLKRLLGTSMGLTKLHLKMPDNPFEYIFLIDTLMSTRISPLVVTMNNRGGRDTKMEFWDAAKIPPPESIGKWIQLPHSMVHVQGWHYKWYKFQQINSNVGMFLSGVEEMAHDASGVELDFDMSLLTEAGIKVFQKAMASLRPWECSVIFKEYKQEWAHCYDFDPMCWSRLSKLTVSGEDMVIWLQRPGSAFKRELMPSLRLLYVEGQGSGSILSGSLANWLASMVSSNEAFQPLTNLMISETHFSHEDWRTILGSIDYSSLKALVLSRCDLVGAFPGSRNNQGYNAADLCRHIGLGTEHQERAAKFVIGYCEGDELIFYCKDKRLT
ncbi:hypothetical protein BG011_001835 [Mortierella polycephala]|uniref:Uncharacterized protein n=1 Tax=Mortierella polycephala TaxID=41804 RepID=A0A9P6PKH2_9FUNG|nr:hypothetical protein BG011_001835 [Mortierella polycephala]